MAFPQLRMIGDLCDSQIGHAYLMTQFRLRCSETPGKKCVPYRQTQKSAEWIQKRQISWALGK